MSGVRNYDPKAVSVIVAGLPVKGFAAEMVRIEPNAEDFTDVSGGDGSVSRARSSDRRATMTLVLQQTSPFNDVLSGLAEKDRLAPNGAGIFSVTVRDRNGTTLVRAKQAWVQRRPDVNFSNEVTNREWQIRLGEAYYFAGGN